MMNKKPKTARKTKLTSLSTSLEMSSPEALQKKMELLGFVRGENAFLKVMKELQLTDRDLKLSHQAMRKCQNDKIAENACISRIQALEDRRFELLSQIYGNRINHYHLSNL